MTRYKAMLIGCVSAVLFAAYLYPGAGEDRPAGLSDIKKSPAYPPGYYEDDPLPDRTAYLTFDDGPSDWTDEVLDVLRSKKVRATFFVCADWAPHTDRSNNDFRKYRGVLVRMIRDGHAIGNHTADHKNLAGLSREMIGRELDENQELLDRELGADSRTMTLVRPPFGSPWLQPAPDDIRAKVGSVLRERGVLCMWSRHFDSSDSMEWVRGEWYEKGPRINEYSTGFRDKMHRIYERLIRRASGKGMVVLFHDTHPTTVETLPLIIDRLKQEKYRFATMEDFVTWRYNRKSSAIVEEERQRGKNARPVSDRPAR